MKRYYMNDTDDGMGIGILKATNLKDAKKEVVEWVRSRKYTGIPYKEYEIWVLEADSVDAFSDSDLWHIVDTNQYGEDVKEHYLSIDISDLK